MPRIACSAACCLLMIGSLLAAPPQEKDVQGLYEGQISSPAVSMPVEVRVVATGKQQYQMLVREVLAEGAEGEPRKFSIAGKTEGDAVAFSGKVKLGDTESEVTATYAPQEIEGQIGEEGKLALKRVQRKPPSLGKQPPQGAVVLLDGKNFDGLVRRNNDPWYVGTMEEQGTPVWEITLRRVAAKKPDIKLKAGEPLPAGWDVAPQPQKVDEVIGVDKDNSIQIPKGGMTSRQRFEGGFDAHIEFRCPLRPEQRGQGRGNSGVHLPNGDEIQVLDSFGMDTYQGGGCGGLYKYKDPDAFDVFSLASLPPLEWQTYDIEYRVKRNEQGKVFGKPVLTVWHNGILIHDHVEPNGGARPGNFNFQDHGNPVRYRNIWVLPVEESVTVEKDQDNKKGKEKEKDKEKEKNSDETKG